MTGNQVAVVERLLPAVSFNTEQLEVIKAAIMPEGSTVAEMSLFVEQCKRTQLDPLSKQIYCFKSRGKLVIGTSIDGFRVISNRSGQYAGQQGPWWCGPDGIWHDVWLKDEFPAAAKVGVLRHDFKEPLYAVAKWNTYKQVFYKDGRWQLADTWQKMPDLMLAKSAESLAMRKAFPNDLSGLYTPEEGIPRDTDKDEAPTVAYREVEGRDEVMIEAGKQESAGTAATSTNEAAPSASASGEPAPAKTGKGRGTSKLGGAPTADPASLATQATEPPKSAPVAVTITSPGTTTADSAESGAVPDPNASSAKPADSAPSVSESLQPDPKVKDIIPWVSAFDDPRQPQDSDLDRFASTCQKHNWTAQQAAEVMIKRWGDIEATRGIVLWAVHVMTLHTPDQAITKLDSQKKGTK